MSVVWELCARCVLCLNYLRRSCGCCFVSCCILLSKFYLLLSLTFSPLHYSSNCLPSHILSCYFSVCTTDADGSGATEYFPGRVIFCLPWKQTSQYCFLTMLCTMKDTKVPYRYVYVFRDSSVFIHLYVHVQYCTCIFATCTVLSR